MCILLLFTATKMCNKDGKGIVFMSKLFLSGQTGQKNNEELETKRGATSVV